MRNPAFVKSNAWIEANRQKGTAMKLKPYMLMELSVTDEYAERGVRTHVVEVMSFPIPLSQRNTLEETIMVRRIPGHPGTLIEVYVKQLKAPQQKYRWVHYAVVAGSGSFPVDMLRYDSCVPVNFTLPIPEPRYSGPKAVLDPAFGSTDLIVADVSAKATPSWTTARWGSFLWGCRHLKTERITGE